MDGILRCSRYAFGPNRLHYCGPDANQEVLAYINEGKKDPGLASLLSQFQTMYPYLKMIADANKIRDAFDEKVVEAYWIGNELLETAGAKNLYKHLNEDGRVKKRLLKKDFNVVIDKVYQGAVPHHSFHVLDIWKRTGHLDQDHNIETLASCCIGWGEITELNGPFVTILGPALILLNGKLSLSDPITQKITRSFEADLDIENLKLNDLISFHWGQVCEKLTDRQTTMLKKFTLRHLELANMTI